MWLWGELPGGSMCAEPECMDAPLLCRDRAWAGPVPVAACTVLVDLLRSWPIVSSAIFGGPAPHTQRTATIACWWWTFPGKDAGHISVLDMVPLW